jgi:hypothetical protein
MEQATTALKQKAGILAKSWTSQNTPEIRVTTGREAHRKKIPTQDVQNLK